MNSNAAKTEATETPTWICEYRYDGGRGSSRVEASNEHAATLAGMQAAKPTWNPGATCEHTRTYRILSANEAAELPHGGIETAIDLSWHRRDSGGRYLVIERGAQWALDGGYYVTSGVIVGTARSASAAKSLQTKHMRRSARRHVAARYDVVPRAAVRVESSRAPYGCLAREG